jgi:hypothetical protein
MVSRLWAMATKLVVLPGMPWLMHPLSTGVRVGA